MKTEQEPVKAMTIQDIKKAFVICCGVQDCTGCPILEMGKRNEHGCKFNLFTSVIDIVTEQERENERLKAEVKQAKIDVLKGLREKCKFDGHTVAVYKNDIDRMIEEVENDK